MEIEWVINIANGNFLSKFTIENHYLKFFSKADKRNRENILVSNLLNKVNSIFVDS